MPPRQSLRDQPAPELLEQDALASALHAALAPRYALLRRLGSGGMGTVYLAREPMLRRLVAVKVLLPHHAMDEEVRERFRREAQVVAAISHPNVIGVHSIGELADGTPYFIMQYVRGRSFAERLEADGPLSARDATRVLAEVASALAAGHRKGIVHRDIKPANIIDDEESGRAMVADFGIAALLAREGAEPGLVITRSGHTVGTPAYMSPEQVLAEPISERSDIYNLGLLGYELLTGRSPYDVGSPAQLASAHVAGTPRRISEVRPDIPVELEALLRRCLAKDPAERPAAEEVAERLAPGHDELLEWPPPGLEMLHRRGGRAISSLWIGTMLVLIPLVAFTALPPGSGFTGTLLLSSTSMFLLATLGLGMLLRTGAIVLRLTHRAARAASLGYGWMTLAEVLFDDRRDGGALIAGLREYAALDPRTRSRVRWGRVAQKMLLASGALVPFFGFFIGVALGARQEAGAPALLSVTLLPMALCVACAGALRAGEAVLLLKPRRRTRPRHDLSPALGDVVAAWNAAFARVRTGQPLGGGTSGRPLLLVALSVAFSAAVIGIAVFTYLLLSIGAVVTTPLRVVPQFAALRVQYADARVLERYRPALDSGITAAAAGDALYAMGSRASPSDTALPPYMKPPVEEVPRPSLPPAPWPGRSPHWAAQAIAGGVTALTPEQLLFLQDAAADPTAHLMAIAGHAPAADLVGAAVRPPLAAGLPPRYLRAPSAGIHFATNAALARAVLALRAGARDSAEREIRRVVNVGFLLMQSPYEVDFHAAQARLREARDVLTALIEREGREDELLALGRADAATTSLAIGAVRRRERAVGTELWRAAGDAQLPPSARWSAIRALVLEPCEEMSAIVFGVDPARAQRLATAAGPLMRTRGDSIYGMHVLSALDAPPAAARSRAREDVATRIGYGVASAIDRLSRSARFRACLGSGMW